MALQLTLLGFASPGGLTDGRIFRDGPPRMEGRSTWSGRERSSHSRFPPVPRVGLVTFLFVSVVGPNLASAVGLKFVSGLRVSDPYGVQFPSALLALLWRCLCAVVRVPAMRCLFVVRRFATLASHYFFLSVRLPFSMRRSCMPVRGRIAFARYRY